LSEKTDKLIKKKNKIIMIIINDMLSMEEIREHLRQAQSLCEKDHVLFLWTIDKLE